LELLSPTCQFIDLSTQFHAPIASVGLAQSCVQVVQRQLPAGKHDFRFSGRNWAEILAVRSGTEAAELRARVQALESVLHERGLGIPSDNRTALPTHEQPDEMSRRDPSHSSQSRESHSRESQSRDKRPRLSAPAQQPASDRPSNGHAEAQRPTSLPQHTPSPSSVRQASLPPNPRPMPDPSPNRVHFDYHLPGDTTERTDWTHGLSSAADRPGALSDEQSHGTLVLSEGGRSKYLGPTAASEWLKEVG
jgi:hypothetical protein